MCLMAGVRGDHGQMFLSNGLSDGAHADLVVPFHSLPHL